MTTGHSYIYPQASSPAGSSSSSSSSEASATTPTEEYPPPPPYSPGPGYRELDFQVKAPNSYPPLTTTQPIGDPAKYASRKSRIQIAHPYARLVAKKGEVKRRKIWNHALEKSLFTPFEISTLGAPHRRGIYTASLECHIDELHEQLLEIGYYPVPFEALKPYKGLNSKTAKSMVANLQHSASVSKLKLLELERANQDLQAALKH